MLSSGASNRIAVSESPMTTSWNMISSRMIRCGKDMTYFSSLSRAEGRCSGRMSATCHGFSIGSFDSTRWMLLMRPPKARCSFFSLQRLRRPLHAAVLAHAPDVNGQQEDQADGENDAVQHIEAQQ